MGDKKRAILFSLSVLPFMLNIALIDFLIPLKYDSVLDNLPLLGFLVTLAWMGSSILNFSVGDLTDRWGVKNVLRLGVLFSFLGSLIFGLSNSALWMTFGVFLWGLSYVMLTLPTDTYALSSFPKNSRGTAYGWIYFFHDLSYAIAPLLGLVIVLYFGINSAIISAALIVLFTIPLLIGFRGKGKEGLVDSIDDIVYRDGIIMKEIKDLKKFNLKEWALLANIFICGLWFVIVLMGAPLLFFHGEDNLVRGALLLFAFMLPLSFVEIIYGRLANSPKTRKLMITVGFSSSALLLLLFFLINNFYILLVLAFITTLVVNMGWTASEVEVSRYLPKGKKAEFMGIFVAARDLGYDVAPLTYGLVAFFGLKLPFLVAGILLVIALVFFLIVNRKKR
jgi:MFS family permease